MAETTPQDLVLRIALVDEDLQELSPSIWRRFRVSAHVHLDLLHDKVLCPIMGWTRNYHTYLMMRQADDSSSPETTYVQQDTNATDTMHLSFSGVVEGSKAKPESVTIGELLRNVEDRVLYVYDLGDYWRHIITLEEKIDSEKSNGAVRVLDGAMRCPDEDGEGCHTYQTDVLDRYKESKADPENDAKARQLAEACFEKHNALNVRGPFWPDYFDVEKCQEAVNEALRSRNWARNSVKMFGQKGGPMGLLPVARIGQQFVTVNLEDDRGGDDDDAFRMEMGETINLKPDPPESSLCNECGNPLHLKVCGACKCARYCSPDCQKKAWQVGHKRACKKEKALFNKYQQEVVSDKPDPDRFVNKGRDYQKKYDPENLRLHVGDRVEARIGPESFGTGHIVKLFWRTSDWPANKPAAPYQIQLDKETARQMGVPHEHALIYSEWDDDYFVRLLPAHPKKKSKSTARSKARQLMQQVD